VTDSREKNEIISSDTEKGQTAERQSEQGNKNNTRRHQRLEFETEVTIYSESGVVPGRTLDISESGIAAILPVALKIGETVELRIKLPITVAITRAVVRNRNVFRHGFEFLQPMRDVLGHEAADACQSCGGTGFIVQTVNGEQGVAFMRTKCRDCNGTGRGGR
jgi:PilZ domain